MWTRFPLPSAFLTCSGITERLSPQSSHFTWQNQSYSRNQIPYLLEGNPPTLVSASLYNSSAISGHSSDKEFLETKDILERGAKIAEPSTFHTPNSSNTHSPHIKHCCHTLSTLSHFPNTLNTTTPHTPKHTRRQNRSGRPGVLLFYFWLLQSYTSCPTNPKMLPPPCMLTHLPPLHQHSDYRLFLVL
jgi:hypothetical protein